MLIDPQRRDAIRELLLTNAQQPAAQLRRRRSGIVASTLLVSAVAVGVVAVVASSLPLTGATVAASDPPGPSMESSSPDPGVQVDCAAGRDPVAPWERGILAVRAGEVVDREQVPFSSRPTEPVVERGPLTAGAEPHPIGAVLCFEIWDVDEGFVRFAQQEYQGDLAALVLALTGPNTQAPSAACTEVWRSQPNLWIVLSDGSTVAPRWPTDGCGDLVGDPAEGLLDLANVPDPTPIGVPGVETTTAGGFEMQEAAGTTLYAEASSAQMDALITGTVRLEDGCFLLESEYEPRPDDAAIALVFPSGTKLSSDGRSADVPGLGPVEDGSTVRGGGGAIPDSRAGEPCSTGGDVLLWQSAG